MELQQQVDEVLNRLSDVPLRIARASTRLSEAEKYKASSDGGWSAAEILAHLRASDDILAHRLHAILVRDNPALPSFDERRWAEIAGYAQSNYESLLEAFTLRRAELVGMLRRVTLDDWKRLGTHEVKGPISLFDIATWLVEHEEEHCLQLEGQTSGVS